MSERSDVGEALLLRAGVGRAEITFSGTGRWGDLLPESVRAHVPPDYLKKEIEVADPAYVRALVIESQGQHLVLLTLDVTAIGARTISQGILSDSADDYLLRLRELVLEEFGIEGASVHAVASHAHQVPQMLCDDQTQLERSLDAIRQAYSTMTSARVGFDFGAAEGLTFNRTLMMKDGTDYTVRSFYAPAPDDEEIQALRPVDSQVGVWRIDRTEGGALAVVYNFGSHLLLGAPDGRTGVITSDHVGVVLNELEQAIGQGVAAFALQGALGDALEVGQFDVENLSTAQSFGKELAGVVLDTYRQIQPRATTMRVLGERIDLQLRDDIPDLLAELKSKRDQMVSTLRYTSLNFKSFLPLYLKHSLHPENPSHWRFRYLVGQAVGDQTLQILDERNRFAVSKYLDSICTMERLADLEERIATLEKHGQVIESLGGKTIGAEFTAVSFGDSALLFAPMELLAETGLRVKRESPHQRTVVVSLADGYLHYAPPAAYYARGGYEVTECLLAPSWEQRFYLIADRLLGELASSFDQASTKVSLH